MRPEVVGDLGVEGRGQERSLADGDDARGPPEPGGVTWPRTSTSGPASSTQGARMTPRNGAVRDAGQLGVDLEGLHLTPEGVAADHHVQAPAKALLLTLAGRRRGRPAGSSPRNEP